MLIGLCLSHMLLASRHKGQLPPKQGHLLERGAWKCVASMFGCYNKEAPNNKETQNHSGLNNTDICSSFKYMFAPRDGRVSSAPRNHQGPRCHVFMSWPRRLLHQQERGVPLYYSLYFDCPPKTHVVKASSQGGIIRTLWKP